MSELRFHFRVCHAPTPECSDEIPHRVAGPERRPDPKKVFVGRWRIVQMEAWDEDNFEMDGPAFIEVEHRGLGSFKFSLVEGQIDCRFHIEGGGPVMEFSWEGHNEQRTSTQAIVPPDASTAVELATAERVC